MMTRRWKLGDRSISSNLHVFVGIVVTTFLFSEQKQYQDRRFHFFFPSFGYVDAQPDYTCNYRSDTTCTARNNGVCNNQGSSQPVPGCENGDCIDCLDQCRQFNYDCDACLNQAVGCYYCPADGTCYNSNEYTWGDQVSGCAGPSNYLSGPDMSCSRPDAIFDDPLYDAQRWMLTMIDVEPVWTSLGITGEGIKVRINDDGVDVDSQNIDLVPNFDLENSCPDGGHLPNPGDDQGHGTKVAGIVAAVANNSHCAMGVAPSATFSSCNVFRAGAVYSELAYGAADGAFDISQSSFGLDACGSVDRRLRGNDRRKLQDAVSCPFNTAASNFDPCTVCESYFQSGMVDDPTSECQSEIVSHCASAFEDDYIACSDFFDIIVGGGCNYDKLPSSALNAISEGITRGRDGKGAVFVIASGNGYRTGDDVNFGGLTNSRFTISVGAVGKNGQHASYSTPGAALSVAAPAGDTEDISKLMTTALGTGGCVDSGQGTSFAAPVVSGVVALMLQANPALSWRDVQNIIARTSTPVENDPDDDTAYRNSAQIWHSNFYGFGIINANKAVTMAMSDDYTLVQQPESTIIVESEQNIDVAIQDQGGEVASTQLVVDDSFSNFVVESVSVFLNLEHFSRGDLEVVLTSPTGTRSVLHPGKRPENSQQNERWKLVTMRNWGETAVGAWTLELSDLAEGDVAECADTAFFAFLNGRSIDCDDAKEDRYCSGGNVIVDPNDPINTDFLELSDNGKTIVESCCECGGGLDTTDLSDILKDWKIQLFGQGGDMLVTPEPTDSDVSVGDDGNTSAPSSPSINGLSCDTAFDIDQESGPLSGTFGQPIDVTQLRGGSCLNFDDTSVASLGYYYKVTGNGNILSVTACLENQASKPGVSVFTGQDCSQLRCLDGQFKQAFTGDCADTGSSYSVSWLSEVGETYFILVSQLATTGIAPSRRHRKLQLSTGGTNGYTVALTETIPFQNQDCDTAAIYTGGVVVGNTIGGSESANCDGRLDSGSWFVIEPGTFSVAGGGFTAGYSFDTCNFETTFNNSVSVFRGSCNNLECISVDYLSCLNGQNGQQVFWTNPAEIDERYFLFLHPDKSIGNDDYSAGSFALSVQATVRPDNDNCEEAVVLTIDGEMVSGSTDGVMPDTASHNFSPSCGLGAAGVWFKVQGNGSTLRASTCHSNTDHRTSVFVFTGSCQRLNCVAAEAGNVEACSAQTIDPGTDPFNSATVNFETLTDTEYYILVASADGSSGNFDLTVSTVNDTPENNLCPRAVELLADQTVQTSTTSSTLDFPHGSFCGTPLDTAGNWFTLEGTGRGMSVSTCGDTTNSDYNTAISVFTGRCNDVSNLKCVTGTSSKDPSCTNGVTVSFSSQIDTTYHIYVHGARPNSMGSTSISVAEFDVVEPNEFCTGAFEAPTDGSRVQGSTEDAIRTATAATYCGVDIESPGLWYYFDSTPALDIFDIEACAADDDETFDVSISVFSSSLFSGNDIESAGCGDMQCVTGLAFTGNLCSASSSSRRNLQAETVQSTIILATQPNLRYHVFVHGRNPSGGEGAGDFELYVRKRTDIIFENGGGVNVDGIIPDLPHGSNLFRWTTIGTPISFVVNEVSDEITSVSLLAQPLDGQASLDGNGGTQFLTYTPKPSFVGYDKLVLSVCYDGSGSSGSSGDDGCFIVEVTFHVVGTVEQAERAKSTQQTSDEGWNKLWLLVLLLLLPCLVCCIWYMFCRNSDSDYDERGEDADDKFEDFDDEFESDNDELVPFSPPEDSDEEEDSDDEEDEDEEGDSSESSDSDDDDDIDVNEYTDDEDNVSISDDDDEHGDGWESQSDRTEGDRDTYFDTSGRLA
mmetsp:Transcript_36249/g.87337  ORF Transcript_36249/g.87337 Transcript_36249/m.87337 type:complete len:1831 (+) Transcript_36249:46-5538(+)